MWNICHTRDREAAHSATILTFLFNIEERNPSTFHKIHDIN